MSTDLQEKINSALKLHQSGQLAEAEALYCEFLKTSPDNASVLNLFGLLKLQNNQLEEAIQYIKKAIEIQPSAYFWENLGLVYCANKNFAEAIECYKTSLELKPDDFDVLFNLALAYRNNSNAREAIDCYKRALELNPKSSDAYFNLGTIYEEEYNDTLSSLKYYLKALEFEPEGSQIPYLLGVTYLKLKDFKPGLEYYESRPSKEFSIVTQEIQYRDSMTSKPLWQGEDISDKTIFVYYEAGLGDTIMYARYLPLLKQKCAKILFKPQLGLMELFKQSDLGVEVIQMGVPIEFDVHLPIMSLPYVLNQITDNTPLSEGYLKSNQEKVQIYHEKFFENNEFKIGIKWQGNSAYEKNRMIPLSAFYELFELPNTKFYSLQLGEGIEQIDELPSNIELIDLAPTFNDFTDTAAAIENLDLVITNDTSVAHLAGALGKKCWVLLPFVQNWRWHPNSDKSIWYDSIKLFKQSDARDWHEVFETVLDELKLIS